MRLRLAVLGIFVAIGGVMLSATGPSFWVIATQAEFLKGTSDGVSIDDLGRVTAGPTIATVADVGAPQIWSLTVDADGTWFAGTGGDGRVVRGRAGQAQPDTIFHATEGNIYAIALAPNGRVYAASSPDGRVYAIERDGTSRVFFDPGEKYIWALAVDPRGRLWVGAGTPAVVYRVDPDGTSHVIYHPAAAHVVALIIDANGRAIAGTESPGRVYRFDANDRPFALLESGMTEVSALAVGRDGAIYAAGMSSADSSGASTPETSTVISVGSAMIAASTGTGSTSATPPGGARSAIFRITPDGASDTLWETSEAIYDLAFAGGPNIVASTGPDGHLYSVLPTGSAALVTAIDAKQITRIVPRDGRYLIASANPGRVFSVSMAAASSSTYTSPVRDAKNAALWGEIRWEASAGVSLFTRSGKTDKPDESWSDWSGPYANHSGDAIKSPQARYLQWKAVFNAGSAGAASSLTSVTIAYLSKNSHPTVSAITIHPPGTIFQKPYSGDDSAVAGLDDSVRRTGQSDAAASGGFGKRMYQKGLQTISWKADDADGDRLSYLVQYRREGDAGWRDLRAGLVDTVFVWDTTTVPDGRYLVRVVASDAPSNTAERALTGERDSDPFDIDNTPPVITADVTRDAAGIHLNVQVHDAQSPLDHVEYAIGGGEWVLVNPVDGLTDSRDERYVIAVKSDADLARLVIRATDVMQNVTSRPAIVR